MQTIKFTDKVENRIIEIHESQNFFLLGIESGELNLTFDLKAENITVNIYGLILGKDKKNFKLRTKTIHSAKNANSWVLLKGIFDDQSIFDFEGMISIAEGASGSDAYLQNENLLLSDEAIVNSSPQLEICNDDVKASHGVTISTLDELQAFYLKSRGLDDKTTDEVLIKGFASEVIQKLTEIESIDIPEVDGYFKK
jgi:Fe-S cluster assembly protein SufD